MNWQLLNPLRWRKSFLALVLGGFVLIWFTFLDTYSLWTRYQLHQQKQELRERTRQLERESAELRTKIERLETDSALLERIAREEYGMKKEGETVYKVKDR
ncbi:MAG: septum formation initiator family protein [Balneolaceae bacterium]|nr:septum formation initiator family protein [Balneolaceae bacterium]